MWSFQEWSVHWSLWALGYTYADRRGWNMNELTVFIGPIQLTWLEDLD